MFGKNGPMSPIFAREMAVSQTQHTPSIPKSPFCLDHHLGSPILRKPELPILLVKIPIWIGYGKTSISFLG